MLTKTYSNIIIFDLETSGLSFKDDQPIEIGAIRLKDGKKIDEIDLFIKINNGGKLDSEIVRLTGITDEILTNDGVTEAQAVDRLIDFFGGMQETLFIAHNAQFDITFLLEMFNRHNLKLSNYKVLDTLTVYKDRAPYPHKLSNAIEFYKIENVQNSHRAIDDVRALHKVLGHMSIQEDNLEKYINLFGYNPKYGVSGEGIEGIIYKAQPYRSYRPLYENV